jgi:hypothetical protein
MDVCVRRDVCFVQCRYNSLVPWKRGCLECWELDVGTQAKFVMLKGNSSERRSNSRQCKVVNIR